MALCRLGPPTKGGPFLMPERVLMTPEDIRRALVRIAHEIVESNRGARDLVLIGMRTRGAPIANRLAATIGEIEAEPIAVGVLDISPYRDDLPSRGVSLQLGTTDILGDLNGNPLV